MPQRQEATDAQPADVGKRRRARRGNRRSLGTRVAKGRSPLVCWSYLDRRHLELVFGRRLGGDRDRTFASYLGSCRRARSSVRATIVSRVAGAAAGRTFSPAACDRIDVDITWPVDPAIDSSSAWVKLIFSGTLFIVRECSDNRFTSQ